MNERRMTTDEKVAVALVVFVGALILVSHVAPHVMAAGVGGALLGLGSKLVAYSMGSGM